MTTVPLAPQGTARRVVTMPPSPSRIERVLERNPASALLAFTQEECPFAGHDAAAENWLRHHTSPYMRSCLQPLKSVRSSVRTLRFPNSVV